MSGSTFTYRGKHLQIVKTYCYLGIDFASSGSFRIGRSNAIEKARKAMSPLLSSVPDFQVSCKKSLGLFHSLIRPIASYNSENMTRRTHRQIKAIEENTITSLTCLTTSGINTLHQKFLKYILGVKRNYSSIATLGELGEFPLQISGFISLLSYWHRTTLMREDTLVKKTLNLVTNDGPDSSELLATVKFLLKLLHLEEYILDPAVISTDQLTNPMFKYDKAHIH